MNAAGDQVIDCVPIERDGAQVFVQATPDLVTPPAIATAAEPEDAFDFSEHADRAFRAMNAMIEKWSRER